MTDVVDTARAFNWCGDTGAPRLESGQTQGEFKAIDYKRRVREAFGQSAATYDEHARVQRTAADMVCAAYRHALPMLPSGPVLEIGCGTGFLSRELVTCLNGRALLLLDICPEMISMCRRALLERSFRPPDSREAPQQLQFVEMDGESVEADAQFAAVVSSFSMQWFVNLPASIARLVRCLKPGGRLIFSVPGAESFPEWRSLCAQSGVPFSANPLPRTDALYRVCGELGLSCSIRKTEVACRFAGLRQALGSIKHVGASTRAGGSRELTVGQLRKLLRMTEANREMMLTYSILLVEIGPC